MPQETPSPEIATATVARTAELTGLSKSSIYRLWREGRIQFRKLGRTTLVDWATVRAYIESLPVSRPHVPSL